MAKEIQVGYGRGGGSSFDLIFYYPVPVGQRVKARDATGAATGTDVVWTPSTSAPEWAKFTTAENTALDAGTAIFRLETMSQGKVESDAAFLARVQTRYAELGTLLLADYQTRFKHLNKRFDAS